MSSSQISRSKKIRTGDTILMIAGNYKGQRGKVLSYNGEKVLVQGVNICKKHVKRSEQNPKGGIVEMEKPVHISNVRLCDKEGNPVKAKMSVQDGKKALVSKHDEALVLRSLAGKE